MTRYGPRHESGYGFVHVGVRNGGLYESTVVLVIKEAHTKTLGDGSGLLKLVLWVNGWFAAEEDEKMCRHYVH